MEIVPENRDNSMEDFNALINRIKLQKSLSEDEIAIQIGYNAGYISQTRSRGKVSAKFIKTLIREFEKTDSQEKPPKKKMIPLHTLSDKNLAIAKPSENQKPETLEDAVKALLNNSETMKMQAEALVRLLSNK